MNNKKKQNIKKLMIFPLILLAITISITYALLINHIRTIGNKATKIVDVNVNTVLTLYEILENINDIQENTLYHILAPDNETMKECEENLEHLFKVVPNQMNYFDKFITQASKDQYEIFKQQYEIVQKSSQEIIVLSEKNEDDAAYQLSVAGLKEPIEVIKDAIYEINTIESNAIERVKKEIENTYIVAWIVVVMCCIIGFSIWSFIIFLLTKRIIKPTIAANQVVTTIIEEIDAGKGDLTKRVEVLHNDEIGSLGEGINRFIETLHGSLKTIVTSSEKMNEVVTEVLSSVASSQEGVNELSALSEELSAGMEEVSSSVNEINDNSEAVTIEVNQIADRTKEIASYTKKLKENAEAMEANAKEKLAKTEEKVNEILAVLNQAIEDSKSVEQINSLTQEILDIAQQTNLLALNANIEAARAGEAGKGFAVVANEIGQLANSSSVTANRIQEINLLVTDAVTNLANNAEELVTYLAQDIMHEFEVNVENGLRYKDGSIYIEDAMNHFTERTQELRNVIAQINASIGVITNSVNEGADGINGVTSSIQALVGEMETIRVSMDENSEIVEELKEQTSIFEQL